MVCKQCGNPVEGAFCSKCGTAAQAPAAPPAGAYGVPPAGYGAPPAGYSASPGYGIPAMPYVPRVQRHVQTLGILWCVFGAYRVLSGIAAALFLFGISSGRFIDHWGGRNVFVFGHQPWMAAIGGFVAVVALLLGALAFATGFALLTRKPWGRTLGIVAAILSLIKLPFGTALGIYTLWVLAPQLSGAEYDAIADRT